MADTNVVKYGMFRLLFTIKYMFSVALKHPSKLLNTKEFLMKIKIIR